MFNEIMKNVTEYLAITKPSYMEYEDKTPVTKYLSLGYDIPADSIVKVQSFKISPEIPKIYLVDVDFKEVTRVVDYTIIGGEVCKVITFDTHLMRESETNTIATVVALLGDICITIGEHYIPMIENAKCNVSFSNLISYAPIVMLVAYLNDTSPYTTDETITKILSYMNPRITETTIASIRRLISEFTIQALFDDAVWYGVSNSEYPEIRYNERFTDNQSETDNDGWESGSDEEDDLYGYSEEDQTVSDVES